MEQLGVDTKVVTEQIYEPNTNVNELDKQYVKNILDSVNDDLIENESLGIRHYIERLMIIHPDTRKICLEFLITYSRGEFRYYITVGNQRTQDDYRYEIDEDEEMNELNHEQIREKILLNKHEYEQLLFDVVSNGLCLEYFLSTEMRKYNF
jgi:hypothetical protein